MTTAFANPGGKQLTVLTLPAAERYYVNNFNPAAPYVLCGPKPDKCKADVWDIYRAARAAGYDTYFLPGLVMMVGPDSWLPNQRFMVMFASRYHHRFAQASSSGMLITDKAEFLAWLAAHPQ